MRALHITLLIAVLELHLFFDNYNQAILFLNLQTFLPPNIMIEIMSKFIFIFFPFKGKALFSQF